jgi:hypothetical protein
MFPLTLAEAEPAANAADLAAYEAAKQVVGRDAAAHVRLALWCEAHGLSAERTKHLALAVLSDPANTMARGLMGLVSFGGQWKRPDSVAEKVKADDDLSARLAEYNRRRARTPETADAQWALGLWCEQNGLDAEALAHFTAVTRLDPSREAAWKRLGCKKVGGRWVSEGQLAAEKDEAEAQKKADKHWKPLLTKWRGWLREANRRDEAERLLAEISDPRAVASVWSVLVAGSSSTHTRAVEVLGHIDAPAASRALAFLAVFDPSAEVRRRATETLRRRDPREFGGLLVGLLRKKVKYEVKPVGGPGSLGALFVEGKRVDVQRIYAPPAMPIVTTGPNSRLDFDINGLPVIADMGVPQTTATWALGRTLATMTLAQFQHFDPSDPTLARAVADYRAHASSWWSSYFKSHHSNAALMAANPSAELRHLRVDIDNQRTTITTSQAFSQIPIGQMALEYQKAAVVAQQQLARDVARIDAYNQDVQQLNERITGVLKQVSGNDPGDDPESWTAWWVGLKGYAYTPPPETPRPTVVENVPLDYTPQPTPALSGTLSKSETSAGFRVTPYSTMPSCFGAGTLVQTLAGAQLIESIRVGDRVLTQDIKTGALGYHPVTVIHHNPPSPTFLVKVGGDTIVSSPFHRFWVTGSGWIMARDLKGGETLRLLDGPASVQSVETGPVQPVFNLDVAGDHDFFAGAAAALVHDNTLPELRLEPFDAVRDLAPITSTH